MQTSYLIVLAVIVIVAGVALWYNQSKKEKFGLSSELVYSPDASQVPYDAGAYPSISNLNGSYFRQMDYADLIESPSLSSDDKKEDKPLPTYTTPDQMMPKQNMEDLGSRYTSEGDIPNFGGIIGVNLQKHRNQNDCVSGTFNIMSGNIAHENSVHAIYDNATFKPNPSLISSISEMKHIDPYHQHTKTLEIQHV